MEGSSNPRQRQDRRRIHSTHRAPHPLHAAELPPRRHDGRDRAGPPVDPGSQLPHQRGRVRDLRPQGRPAPEGLVEEAARPALRGGPPQGRSRGLRGADPAVDRRNCRPAREGRRRSRGGRVRPGQPQGVDRHIVQDHPPAGQGDPGHPCRAGQPGEAELGGEEAGAASSGARAGRCDVTKCTGACMLPSSTGRAAIGSTDLRRRTTAARAAEGGSVAPS